MQNLVSFEVFKALFPFCKDHAGWYSALCNVLSGSGLNTKNRIACFLAQVSHESGDFTITTENLNYSSNGLLATFKKYFPTVEVANQYARKPEAIANKVYAGRMGNGDEKSGDGWKYRGRGVLQITGKDNYTSASMALFGNSSLLQNPDQLATDKELSIRAALWFWDRAKLSPMADQLNMLAITKAINGGTIGLDDRQARFKRIYSAI